MCRYVMCDLSCEMIAEKGQNVPFVVNLKLKVHIIAQAVQQ